MGGMGRGGTSETRAGMRSWAAALAVFAFGLVAAAPVAGAADFVPGACPTDPPNPALDDASCGSLVVPENRTDPDSRNIRLAVAILPAESPTPAPDPIVHMAGGRP